MRQRICWGEGSIASLGDIIPAATLNRLFLVSGKHSYAASGAAAAVLDCLPQQKIVHFSDFSVNPCLADLLRGIDLFRAEAVDSVLAVGGGSVIDMAKLIALLAVQQASPEQCLADSSLIARQGVPLLAVPTTAGSGSEATQFAVVYVDGIKQSLDHPWLLPAAVIIDPRLTGSLTAAIAASSGWDALSQAMESYWSVRATEESKGYAAEALRLAYGNLLPAVSCNDDASRWQMSMAAFLAGKAINLTRTTAPHAVSYAMTSRFGISHGQAVALTLPLFLQYNYAGEGELLDPRGNDYVRRTIEELCSIAGCASVTAAMEKIRTLLAATGLATTFAELQIDKATAVKAILAAVDSDRLSNNPRKITLPQLQSLLLQL
jgi:alcohol dehydrogenase class IV